MASGKFISYLRVSTERQGKSGLGLEAQREAIERYLNGGQWKLLGEFIEVESGKKNERPKLQEALAACQRTGATLIIAKLDRLSRNVAFIANLMDSGVEFVACDFPTANRLTIHILAAMAEYERDMISKRTKDALQAAKVRGKRLGTPENLSEASASNGRVLGTEARKKMADNFANGLYVILDSYLKEGMSLNSIARKLNNDGILSATGKTGVWTPTAVKNILARVKNEKATP